MASPVGHALVGIGLAAISVPLLGVTPGPALWLGAIVASGVPDLDFVGVLLGFKQERVHRQGTHSLLVLSVLAALALWASHLVGELFDRAIVWVWSIALLAHPLVDTLTTMPNERRANLGLPLFWPISSHRFYLARPLVRPPSLNSYTSKTLLHDLLPELVLFGPACLTLVLLGSIL